MVIRSKPVVGGRWFTAAGERWYKFFLRDRNASTKGKFDKRIVARASKFGPIGGNAVLLAAVDLGLYEDASPK